MHAAVDFQSWASGDPSRLLEAAREVLSSLLPLRTSEDANDTWFHKECLSPQTAHMRAADASWSRLYSSPESLGAFAVFLADNIAPHADWQCPAGRLMVCGFGAFARISWHFTVGWLACSW